MKLSFPEMLAEINVTYLSKVFKYYLINSGLNLKTFALRIYLSFDSELNGLNIFIT